MIMSPAGGGSSSSRWCPTPEQLMILEELYRRGLRTPKASQIQKITAHLACYGKIQGKNVFYWFQNHKARDRQKLRKKQLANQLLLYDAQPPTFHFQLSAFQDLHAQASGIGEEGGMRFQQQQQQQQTWKADLPKDCLIRTYGGHDSMMIMDMGPTQFPCWPHNRPPQTLELFPLTPKPSP